MNNLPITIVIPCSNDLLIERCIRSIDESLEVVVSLNNPTQAVRNILKKFPDVKTVETAKKGIALAYNNGIKATSNDWILLMDSDCIFEKKAIYEMWKIAKEYKVVKGRIVFSSKGYVSKVVAKLREFTTSDTVNAYSPPLLFDKKIVDKIGYYFNPKLVWSEDADFNNRVQKNNIKIGFAKDGIIYHKNLTFKEDLRSAFYYGVGRQIGKEIGVYKPHTLKSFSKNIIFSITNAYKILINKKSLAVAVYYFFFWNIFFRFGTYSQYLFKIIDYEKI
ncbi:MAG: glycosyltransferase [Patescibacteria group bacterium]